MAITTPTLLDTETLQTGDALNSASISPSANALLIIVHCVLASSGSGWTDAVSDSFGSNLGDWSSVGVEIDGAATVHMWIHYAQCNGTPGSGTVTVDPSAGTRQIMFVLELTGHNTTSPVVQSKTYSSDATPTSPTITLDDSPASGSLVLGAIGGGVGTTSSGATSGTGFTELADTRVGTTGVTSCAVQYDNGGADTTCDWSLSNYGQTIVGIALEIAAAGSSDITGSLAATLGAATLSADGDVDVQGAVAQTLGSASLSSAGTVDVQGALSQTLADATLSADGDVEVQGAVAQTLGDASLSAAGIVEVQGALSQTLADATLSADGDVEVQGAVAQTLDDASLSAAGVVVDAGTITGSLNQTLGDANLSGAGTVEVSGILEQTLADASLTAGGTAGSAESGHRRRGYSILAHDEEDERRQREDEELAILLAGYMVARR